jgi:hypothetical protein
MNVGMFLSPLILNEGLWKDKSLVSDARPILALNGVFFDKDRMAWRLFCWGACH